MDRDELQERIRARRSGGEPYRRGAAPDDEYGGYQRFEPDPTDAQARRAPAPEDRRTDYLAQAGEGARQAGGGPDPISSGRSGGPRDDGPLPDLTRDRDDWTAPSAPGRAVPPPVAPLPPSGQGPAAPTADYSDYAGAPRADYVDDASYDPDAPYEYDGWEDDRERRSGAGGFAILGFLALGVLALLGGAVLAGVFSGDPGVAEATSTPSIAVSQAPIASTAPSVAASAAPSGEPVGSSAPSESGGPVVFPDGFTAEAQPCIPGSVRPDGCDSSGAVNNGQVEIWVGFQNGSSADIVGAEILGPDGNTIGEGTIDLSRIGCGATCNGHTYFNFANLGPGMYEVRITRNGERADTFDFEVS